MAATQVILVLEGRSEDIRAARHFVRTVARTLGVEVDVGDLELLVSELFANASQLAAGEVSVAVRPLPGRRGLRVEVRDHGYGTPEASRSPVPSGLNIVERLADGWGVDQFLPGKIVWFELAAREGPLPEDPGEMDLLAALTAHQPGS